MSRRSPSRPLSPEERDLWRRVAKAVNPLDAARAKRLDDIAPPSSDPRPKPADSPLKTGPINRLARREPERVKIPADRSTEKKVRRGHLEVEARIDLHGLTSARARSDLLGFLRRAQGNGMRQVLVITGKGAGARAQDQRRFEPWASDAPPLPGVLRRSFTQWMTDPAFAPLVSGYAQAHRRHGGSGAFYVMVRL
ncbi:Smr/MutS family protein [Maricaulaceae bacterium MS644]